MGLADALRRGLSAIIPPVKAAALDPAAPSYYLSTPVIVDHILGMSAADVWRTQPYLRTVVTFMARNIAQLGLHTFERVSDTDRTRLIDHPVARLLRNPNPTMTSYELVYRLVADKALYDRAYWLLSEDVESTSGWRVTPIPPSWVVATKGGSIFGPATYVVQPINAPGQIELPAENVLAFHGWHPDYIDRGSSPVEALKQILAEQMQAQAYRQQVWQRGGRVSTVLTRPDGAGKWSDQARERFRQDWKSRWTGDGEEAGGTPILEDGMTLNRLGFSAHEEEYVEAAKLALTVVAAVYHVNPTMIGLLDNANYSNVREFRRSLYGDTLGPVLAEIEDRVNTFLVPRMPSPERVYVEFNIGEKLQGSFEEQAAAMQASVGRPWMTADEARAKLNMPSLGGDAAQLVTPLNVLVGGQASPQDSGSQNLLSGPVRMKARAPQSYQDKHVEVLAKFFTRQAKVVKSRLGSKAGPEWWDAARWDSELSDDLYSLAVETSKKVAASTLDSIGFSPDVYDIDRTLKFLRSVSDRVSSAVNLVTLGQLQDAVGDPDDPGSAVDNVFEKAQTSRATQIAITAVTTVSAFATTESAKQAAGDKATKTWITGSNPRPEHASMNGETVGIEDNFSNGAPWPGSSGDVDEDAGCNCSLEVGIP